MTLPNRFQRMLIVIVAATGLGLAGFLLWSNPPPEAEGVTSALESQADAGADAPEAIAHLEDNASRTLGTPQQPLTAANGSESRQTRGQPINVPVTIPHDVAMSDYKRELWYQVAANPPPLKQPGDPEVDADLAYRIYMFYGNCSVVPRTAQQVDQKLGHIERRIERAGLQRLEGLEGRVDEIMDFFELCSSIPDDVDRREESVLWMTEAVRLEHEIAQVQFYEKAMGFMLRPDYHMNRPPLAMEQPGLVEQFKDTARLGLARALEKGHPEAFVARSQATLEGLIYPRDPQQAYAYARASELVAGEHRNIAPGADYWKNAAAQFLDPDQLAEAEQLALELRAAAGD